ncbi:MAG: transposase [Candidatus Aminicenantales bacterium]
MEQPYLIRAWNLAPKVYYEKIFEYLPSLAESHHSKGRPSFSKNSLLRALVYKNLRGLPSLTELAFELRNNLLMAETLGFPAWETPPSIERFSQFLRSTSNEDLQALRRSLVHYLIQEKVIAGETLAMDSCPIEANIRENNLKTSVKDRFDKNRKCSGDPEAKLGVKIHYPKPFERKIAYFWGYRNHLLIDAETELPLGEKTWPANKDEKSQAIAMLKEIVSTFGLPTKYVIADANYDTEEILSYIFFEMKAEPIIPKNPRRSSTEGFMVKKEGVICPAGLQMHRRGKMTVKGITYLQYSCPLYYGPKSKRSLLLCLAGHPKSLSQKGCNHLIRLSPSVREMIDYGSHRFKELYSRRTSVERVFSRLLAISMQKPTVIGLEATKNHCTIAHISVLLIALAAHRLGAAEKIRFVKTFLPNLYL